MAQTPPPLPDVRNGATVWATSNDGREIRGRVLASSLSEIGLEMQTGDRLTLSLDEVRRIEVKDSNKNGALLGAVIGGAAGAGFATFIIWALCETDPCEGSTQAFLALSGIGAGGGAAAGALIDASIDGRRIVYEQPSPSRLTIGPAASPKSIGVRMSFRW
jgi:hypothetical protein